MNREAIMALAQQRMAANAEIVRIWKEGKPDEMGLEWIINTLPIYLAYQVEKQIEQDILYGPVKEKRKGINR